MDKISFEDILSMDWVEGRKATANRARSGYMRLKGYVGEAKHVEVSTYTGDLPWLK